MGQQVQLEVSDWVYHSDDHQELIAQDEAFHRLYAELRLTYENQFVDIHQGALIDSDADEITIIERIESTYPQQTVLIRKVTSTPPTVVDIPSFRL